YGDRRLEDRGVPGLVPGPTDDLAGGEVHVVLPRALIEKRYGLVSEDHRRSRSETQPFRFASLRNFPATPPRASGPGNDHDDFGCCSELMRRGVRFAARRTS